MDWITAGLVVAVVFLFCTYARAKAVDRNANVMNMMWEIYEEDIFDLEDMYSDYLLRHTKNKDNIEDLEAIKAELKQRRDDRRRSKIEELNRK